jgi:hypothetical protein
MINYNFTKCLTTFLNSCFQIEGFEIDARNGGEGNDPRSPSLGPLGLLQGELRGSASLANKSLQPHIDCF